jgi:hypothetical protein
MKKMKKMKTMFLSVIVAMMLLTFQPLLANSPLELSPSSIVDPVPVNSSEIKVITERLDEIKAMDISELSSSEKKVLRKEVRAINYELNHPGAIYISGGTLIVVIILLIILL